MTEQAINTVYALGERPDILCDNLIKNLTRRAFNPKRSSSEGKGKDKEDEHDVEAMDQDQDKEDQDEEDPDRSAQTQESTPGSNNKDVGDAFELSQLLFVVGHVAIKHIVYLELVEREWKRQKHEKEQGIFLNPRLSIEPHILSNSGESCCWSKQSHAHVKGH